MTIVEVDWVSRASQVRSCEWVVVSTSNLLGRVDSTVATWSVTIVRVAGNTSRAWCITVVNNSMAVHDIGLHYRVLRVVNSSVLNTMQSSALKLVIKIIVFVLNLAHKCVTIMVVYIMVVVITVNTMVLSVSGKVVGIIRSPVLR